MRARAPASALRARCSTSPSRWPARTSCSPSGTACGPTAAWQPANLDADRWVDPAVCTAAGIADDDLERYLHPAPFERPTEPVPQPEIDPDKPHLAYPEKDYAAMVALPDDVVTKSASTPDPPV